MSESITIYDLALHKLGRRDQGDLTAEDCMRVQLPFFSGCELCGASMGPGQARPSRSGYVRCKDCIGEEGYDTAYEANVDIFGQDDVVVEGG